MRVAVGHALVRVDLRAEALEQEHEPAEPVRRRRARRQGRAASGRALSGNERHEHQRHRNGDTDEQGPAGDGHDVPTNSRVRSRTAVVKRTEPLVFLGGGGAAAVPHSFEQARQLVERAGGARSGRGQLLVVLPGRPAGYVDEHPVVDQGAHQLAVPGPHRFAPPLLCFEPLGVGPPVGGGSTRFFLDGQLVFGLRASWRGANGAHEHDDEHDGADDEDEADEVAGEAGPTADAEGETAELIADPVERTLEQALVLFELGTAQDLVGPLSDVSRRRRGREPATDHRRSGRPCRARGRALRTAPASRSTRGWPPRPRTGR